MSESKRSRWTLVLVFVAFMLPFLAAVVMRFGGWEPQRTRNFGQLLEPPISMQEATASSANGPWEFVNQEHEWSLLVRSAADCTADCQATLEVLPNVRRALGRHAGRLHMFRLTESSESADLPSLQLSAAPALLQTLPTQGAEVWLVDPHGYLVMHYAAGFDPSGLRKDLSRLIR